MREERERERELNCTEKKIEGMHVSAREGMKMIATVFQILIIQFLNVFEERFKTDEHLIQ